MNEMKLQVGVKIFLKNLDIYVREIVGHSEFYL